jgi:hypothetical protein
MFVAASKSNSMMIAPLVDLPDVVKLIGHLMLCRNRAHCYDLQMIMEPIMTSGLYPHFTLSGAVTPAVDAAVVIQEP